MAIKPDILTAPPDWARIAIARGSSTALEPGDFASLESNAIVLMDTVTEDATFAGLVLNRTTSDFAEPDKAVVGQIVLARCDCTSATYSVSAGLKYTSENALVADGSANTIAWSHQYAASAVTRLIAFFNVYALGKLFAVSA